METWQLVITIAAVAGGAFGIFRSEALKQSYKAVTDANTEMREQIRFNQQQHESQRLADREAAHAALEREVDKRHQGERECSEKIGELQGQVTSLQNGSMRLIVSEAMTMLEPKVDELLKRLP